ncbi:MFS transporter [Teichococcus vastitatis]|uniref:MFS transporter n=1 Tax=Teichococcus vastitatis TaxID=2307076 RepID=A0ABS9W5N8_9PROT|nr:MFS transporter [Pseudoroseomonas vastitatis]MCI0754609.1 MFS transporter [Pseudoroseomonas vastitatis]
MSEHSASRPHQRLTRQDLRTLVLASLGGALEFYDFIIFVFFAAAISHLFFPPGMPDWLQQIQTFGIFAAGYLARPLGGLIMAHFGDKLGRKRMFTFSIFLMAVPTLLIGLTPTYETLGYAAPILLLLFRMMQGAAIGGEGPGAWVFVSEHVPPHRVGLAVGMLTGGLTGGIMLGSLMATAINTAFTPAEVSAWAWRIAFLVGGVFGFLAMYLRRFLHETPVFEEMRRRAGLTRDLPIKQVLRGHGRGVVVSMLVTWMLTAAIVVVILMTPTLLQKLHGFTAAETLRGNLAATFALTVSAMLVGALLDRFGSVKVGVTGSVALIAATYGLYTGVATRPDLLVPLYAVAGATIGVIAVVPYVMIHSFPAPIRFSGVSFSYNMAYAIFGGLTPLLVSGLVAVDRLGPAHYVAAVALIGLVTLVANARAMPGLSAVPAGAENAAR